MKLQKARSLAGGAHLWEHPEDYMLRETCPTIWKTTAEMQALEQRTGARRALQDQYWYDGPARKPTCLSGTVKGLEKVQNRRCPGASKQHVRAKTFGKEHSGKYFNSRRLQDTAPSVQR